MLEVVQADRDRIADRYRERGQRGIAKEIAAGEMDDDPYVQMLAAHRISTLSGVGEIVEALETALEALEIEGVCEKTCDACDKARKALARFREQQS